MGCTTVDSMLNNWVVGHQWLVQTFGVSARPKVGWSLDPFGMSGSQAVLQALIGMEAVSRACTHICTSLFATQLINRDNSVVLHAYRRR